MLVDVFEPDAMVLAITHATEASAVCREAERAVRGLASLLEDVSELAETHTEVEVALTLTLG